MPTEEDHAKGRQKAVEGLLLDVLRHQSGLAETLLARPPKPMPLNAPEWVEIERAARHQLLTRAVHPEGLLAVDDLDDEDDQPPLAWPPRDGLRPSR